MTRDRCDGSGCLMDFDAWARRVGWIVIDPEDRKQTVRLQKALRNHVLADEIRDALRSLIEPPKPEEPTDPSTRVSDRRENIWRLLADGDWVCTSGPDIGEYIAWDRLADDRGPLTIEVGP